MAAELVNGDDEPLERIERSRPGPRGRWESYDLVPALYLEDVEAIHHALSRHTDAVEMRTDEFKIRNLKQLATIPRKYIPHFRIASVQPNVTLTLKPDDVTLTSYGDDAASVELFDEIKAVVKRRQNVFLARLTSAWALMVASFGMSGMGLWTMRKEDGQSDVITLSITATFLAVVVPLTFWKSAVWPKRRGVLIPQYKRDAPEPWFASDTMKIALVTGVLTAIVTAVATAAVTLLIVDGQTSDGDSRGGSQPVNQPSVASPQPTSAPSSGTRFVPNPTATGEPTGSRVRPRSAPETGTPP